MKHFVVILSALALASAVDFEIKNNLPGPIWVGILGNSGYPSLANGGFALNQGETKQVSSSDDWAGRFWPRTWCNMRGDNNCQTGDCGNRLQCNGAGGQPPATLVEIKLKGWQGQDFYDISLVDGFNTKASIEPVNGQGNCRALRCNTDINARCPGNLQKRGGNNNEYVVGCYSACAKFNQDNYCCRGQYGPNNCNPNSWAVNSAALFKSSCPDAYSYAYDDATSTFTCLASKYRITFG